MKKPALVLTLIFVFFTNLPLGFSDDPEQVMNTRGLPISPNGMYNIVPPNFSQNDGGVLAGLFENSDCPVTVIQSVFGPERGDPVAFFSLLPDINLIFTNSPLEIQFTKQIGCAGSSKWSVFEDTDISYVGIGESQNHGGQQKLSGTFQVQRFGTVGSIPTYKLVFCDNDLCSDIGRSNNVEDNGRRLILTNNEPFEVVFEEIDFVGIKTVV